MQISLGRGECSVVPYILARSVESEMGKKCLDDVRRGNWSVTVINRSQNENSGVQSP